MWRGMEFILVTPQPAALYKVGGDSDMSPAQAPARPQVLVAAFAMVSLQHLGPSFHERV